MLVLFVAISLGSTGRLAFELGSNNDKHRFTLHETFGLSESMTSKVSWLRARRLSNG